MPTYTFTTDAGDRVERTMSVKEYETRVRDGVLTEAGATLTRDMMADIPGGPSCGGWPIKSLSMGCHPSQIEEFKGEARRAGIDIDFTPTGDAILRDKAHRKAYRKHRGMVDFDGGYND